MDRSLVLGIALGLVFAWVWGWTLQYLAAQHQNTRAAAWRAFAGEAGLRPTRPAPWQPPDFEAFAGTLKDTRGSAGLDGWVPIRVGGEGGTPLDEVGVVATQADQPRASLGKNTVLCKADSSAVLLAGRSR